MPPTSDDPHNSSREEAAAPDWRSLPADTPEDEELILSGPGQDDLPSTPDDSLDGTLPGGLDHTTAAAGAGAGGALLLALAGLFKRRSWRKRFEDLDP